MSDSPVKKLDFQSAGKDNASTPLKPVEAPAEKNMEKAVDAPKVAHGIKQTEANEPLLQENPHRFVLFPIKYHEVCHVPTRPRVKCPKYNGRAFCYHFI